MVRMDRRGGTWKLLGSVVYAHSKVKKKVLSALHRKILENVPLITIMFNKFSTSSYFRLWFKLFGVMVHNALLKKTFIYFLEVGK